MKKYAGHLLSFVLFAVISLAFFYPVLQGKKIFQSDIVQYIGMAKERNDYRAVEESYWTNSAFGGMPTYQLGAEYEHNYIKKLDRVIRFLPRPADYLFLYFIGFYVLLLAFKLSKRYAFLGALAFGFSTYLIIILGVGHNAKAHAVGYFAFVLASVLLAFERKYFLAFLLTTLSMALEINANHFQMTYYLGFLILILGGVEFYRHFKDGRLKDFFKASGVLISGVGLAILLNATSLLTTREYAEFSTRSKSELSITSEGLPKQSESGLNKQYITEYSYGIAETLNLIVPRLFGGSNAENVGENSNTYRFLISQGVNYNQALNFTENLPTYWGDQPIVAAPAYISIVVFLLFVLGLFVLNKKYKVWLLGGILLSLVLSWGKNLPMLTNLMIDYFPLYNKFRAVSSIQVILEFCVPIIAVLGLYEFVKKTEENINLKKQFFYSSGIVLGILVLLFIGKSVFSFEGPNDAFYAQQLGEGLLGAIVEDRKYLYNQDLFRALTFVSFSCGLLLLFVLKRIKKEILLIGLGLLISVDLVSVAKRYVNETSFVEAHQMDHPFTISPAEERILKDTTHFRVFNTSEGLNGARTSYFFKSVGGYHAAKPKRIQELFEYQLYGKQNTKILDMLNVKYILHKGQNGEIQVSKNPNALGNAWFIEHLIKKGNANEVMLSLDTLNLSESAVYTSGEMASTQFKKDSLSHISLETTTPNKMIYKSQNAQDGFAVFSENYYKEGWRAFIDHQETPIYRVNYTLRGIKIPKGIHQITFEFKPEIVEIGSKITLLSSILFALIIGFYIYYEIHRNKPLKNDYTTTKI